MSISVLFLLFIIYSFIGWILEILYTLITDKILVNRGFLIGPYCPIYGIGVILIILLLERYKSSFIVLFVMSMFICSLLEYITSYALEKLFNARWWDYTNKKYNINGRICLELLIPFGILGCVVIYFINPLVMQVLLIISPKILNILSIVISILFFTDVVLSCNIIKKIKISATNIKIDNTEEITKKVKEYISNHSWLEKRIIKSFPGVKFLRGKRKK